VRIALLLASLALLPAGPAAAAPGDDEPKPAPAAEEEEKEYFRPEIVMFEPFERTARQGATVRLKFRLKSPYRAPVLIVIGPDGAASYVRPDKAEGREYEIPFRLDPRGGTHRLALAADSPGGVQYGARFFVRATGPDGKVIDRDLDLPPADTAYDALDPEESPLRLERILFHRMNDFRARQGLPRLPWHEGVARCARRMIPSIARRWEETLNPKTGEGQLVHRLPGAGPGGTDGPTIGDLAHSDLGWPAVVSWLPPSAPHRGRDQKNFVSESLTKPAASLDAKFEQNLLRKSDHRAALLYPHLTHAAGAACWRYYGWRADTGRGAAPDLSAPPGPPPRGTTREALAALVFVQVNDPGAEASFEKDRRSALRALSAASKPAERAAALRLVGQFALPESPRILEDALRSKDPEVAAAALDGLWLCAPGKARAAADPMEVRVLTALEVEEEFRAAEALRVLPLMQYDAATRRRARDQAKEVAKRGRAAVDAAARLSFAGDRDGARAALQAAARRFAGFPEGDEAALALQAFGPHADPPPAK